MLIPDAMNVRKTPIGAYISPDKAMALAVQEACKGLGRTAPNPPVGCVIVGKNHRLIAAGYHKGPKQPHAEEAALNSVLGRPVFGPGAETPQAKDLELLQKQLRSAAFYVTLEPCAHKRERLACAEALSQFPLKSVVCGALDPNPKTSGKGLQLLREQGIPAQIAPFRQERSIQKLIEVFSFHIQEKKPFAALKAASSLDGCISPVQSKTPWITCEKSRKISSYIRGFYDAVLVGVDTFLEDDPLLNPRTAPFQDKKNKAVLLDPQAASAPLIAASSLSKVRNMKDIILVTEKELPDAAFSVLKTDKSFDLSYILKKLYKDFQISSLLAEGGAGALSSFIAQNQAQRLYQFIAPVVLGAQSSKAWTEELALFKSPKPLFHTERFQTGECMLVTGLFKNRGRLPSEQA